MGTHGRKALGIGVAGIAAALLVGSAVAVAGPGPKAKAKGLVRGVHAEVSLVKRDGSTDAFVVDRGTVKAESTSSLTIERKDGVSVTLGLDAATKVRGDIEVGKGAMAFSRGAMAFALLAPRAAGPRLGRGHAGRLGHIRRARALFGAVHADVKLIRADRSTDAFSFDRGEVTAVSSTSLTIKRVDGPSVTKSLSVDTRVRGRLAEGGRAAVFSRGSAAFLVLAGAPRR